LARSKHELYPLVGCRFFRAINFEVDVSPVLRLAGDAIHGIGCFQLLDSLSIFLRSGIKLFPISLLTFFISQVGVNIVHITVALHEHGLPVDKVGVVFRLSAVEFFNGKSENEVAFSHVECVLFAVPILFY
jgi:hypothetical protein